MAKKKKVSAAAQPSQPKPKPKRNVSGKSGSKPNRSGKISKKKRFSGGKKPKRVRGVSSGSKKKKKNKAKNKRRPKKDKKGLLKKHGKGRGRRKRKRKPRGKRNKNPGRNKDTIADRAYEKYLKKMYLPDESVVSRYEMNNVVRERIATTVRFENEMPALWTTLLIAAQGVDGSKANDIVVERFIGGPFSARIAIQNNGTDDVYLNRDNVAIFNINGGTLIKNEHTVPVTLPSKEARGGENSIQVGGNWVQSKKQAEELGQWILTNQADGGESYSLDVFGNVFLDIGDIVIIEHAETNLTDAMRFIVTGISHSFSNGLVTSVDVRRVWPTAGRSLAQKSGIPQNPVLL